MKISNTLREAIYNFNVNYRGDLSITYSEKDANFVLSVSGANGDWIPFIVFDATDLYYRLDDQYMTPNEFIEFANFYKLVVEEDIWIGKDRE